MTHLVSERKLVLAQPHTASEALRDAVPVLSELARELEADSTQARAALGVDADARRQLADDGPKVARLQPARGCQCATRPMPISFRPSTASDAARTFRASDRTPI